MKFVRIKYTSFDVIVALKIYPPYPRGKGVYFSKKMINIFYKIIPPYPPILHTPNLVSISYPYSSSFVS